MRHVEGRERALDAVDLPCHRARNVLGGEARQRESLADEGGHAVHEGGRLDVVADARVQLDAARAPKKLGPIRLGQSGERSGGAQRGEERIVAVDRRHEETPSSARRSKVSTAASSEE